jgi:hypothetical protein
MRRRDEAVMRSRQRAMCVDWSDQSTTNHRGRRGQHGGALDEDGCTTRGASTRHDRDEALDEAAAPSRLHDRPQSKRRGHDDGECMAQRSSRPVDQATDRGVGDPELRRDLGIRVALEGRAQDRLVLEFGQRCNRRNASCMSTRWSSSSQSGAPSGQTSSLSSAKSSRRRRSTLMTWLWVIR